MWGDARENGASPYGLTVLGDKVLFAGLTPGFAYELWVTDGTPGGTELLEIEPGGTCAVAAVA